MQLDGLMNILSVKPQHKSVSAETNPAEGILGAFEDGFESILANIESTIEHTAAGLENVLESLPEQLNLQLSQILASLKNLAQGTPLASLLQEHDLSPEMFGLSKEQASEIVFDGEVFSDDKGEKSFDIKTAFEKLQVKVKNFSKDVAEVNTKSRLQTSGDEFLQMREGVKKVQSSPLQSYSKSGSEQTSLFAKYNNEAVVHHNQQPTVMSEQLMLQDAVTGVTNSSRGENAGKNVSLQVFDMSDVNITKSNEVIAKIVNYIDQQQLSSKGELDLMVKHEDLGQFRLNVQRGAQDGAIDMRITAGREGHRFFSEHEVELVKTLNNNGVKLTDFKIVQADVIGEAGSSSKSGLSSNDSSEGRQQFGQQGQQRGGGQGSEGSERRRQMWEDYREKMEASA
jgi:hypothetical protein